MSDAVNVRAESENPLMTFPIKKGINTKLFNDRMAAFYIRET